MKHITTKDLREPLTLLIPRRHDDGEGGWREEWQQGPTVWASVWPLIDKQDKVSYRVVIRAGLTLPLKIGFLWPLHQVVKRLSVTTPPVPIQYHQFLCMTAKEEPYA
jgi:hypothetical protein